MKRKLTTTTTLRALGFCGADDSIDPNLLGLICHAYPFVEFGVLFRPDMEGTPRYATSGWVEKLAQVVTSSSGKMKLAAHLCGSRVNEVLKGDDTFVSTLSGLGFHRVQINATAINGVDTSNLSGTISNVGDLFAKHPQLEFILQKNEETRPLWEGMLNSDYKNCGPVGKLPKNVTMLLDESKGTGVLTESWPNHPKEYDIGYAGGIGPSNIETVLDSIAEAACGRSVWIDMESSLRSQKGGKDVFDLEKCYECVRVVCAKGFHDHPSFLP